MKRRELLKTGLALAALPLLGRGQQKTEDNRNLDKRIWHGALFDGCGYFATGNILRWVPEKYLGNHALYESAELGPFDECTKLHPRYSYDDWGQSGVYWEGKGGRQYRLWRDWDCGGLVRIELTRA